MIAKYSRTPKSKRFNFEKKGIQSPFKPPFNSLLKEDTNDPITIIHSQRIINILCRLLKQGIQTFQLFTTSFIKEIHELLIQSPFKNNFDSNICQKAFIRVRIKVEKGTCEVNSRLFISKNQDEYQDVAIDDIIGYTTSGSFSYSNQKSCAIGVLTLEGIYNLSTNNRFLFLRNIKGRKNFKCNFEIIP